MKAISPMTASSEGKASCLAPPAVSVVIATRNRPELLKRAMASAAKQSLGHYEVIVVDDGSDQMVRDAYTEFWPSDDWRFRLVLARPAGTRGTGPSAARNRGIELARGEFVAFLDDDDEWILPDYLQVGVDCLRRTQADFLFSNMCGVRGAKVTVPDFYAREPALLRGDCISESPKVFEVPYRVLIDVMRRISPIAINSIFRRKLLQDLGGFLERISSAEDVNLALRVIDRARRVLYRPDIAVAYSFSETNSVSHSRPPLETWLQRVGAKQHARVMCLRREIRRCARARESYTLRALSKELMRAKRPLDALSFAWQAVAVFPSAGSVFFSLKLLVQVLCGRTKT